MEVGLSQTRKEEEEENRILPPAGVRAIHGVDAPGMPAVVEEGGKTLALLPLLLLLRSADALSAAALCRSAAPPLCLRRSKQPKKSSRATPHEPGAPLTTNGRQAQSLLARAWRHRAEPIREKRAGLGGADP